MKLKPLSEQVMLITGATSGIGLATARLAAERGAKLALLARGEDALSKLRAELEGKGAVVLCVPVDVADESKFKNAADQAAEYFGAIHSWFNNAGVSIYGKVVDETIDDMRRLFDTNFWGVVYGSRIAVDHLSRTDGGVLINMGSILSDLPLPLQAIYSASKHAVKAFTDALRAELAQDGAPIAVTLIKPGAIDTPYPDHAKNYMSVRPKSPSPLYSPRIVAEAVMHVAETPTREITVGGAGKVLSMMGKHAPRLGSTVMGLMADSQKSRDQPTGENALHAPLNELKERGRGEGIVFESSVYTTSSVNPAVSTAVAAGMIGAGYFVSRLMLEH